MLTLFSFYSLVGSSSCLTENTIFFVEVYLDLEHCPVRYSFSPMFEEVEDLSLRSKCWRPLARIFFILGASWAIRVYITVIPLDAYVAERQVRTIIIFFFAIFSFVRIWRRRRNRISCAWYPLYFCWDSLLGNDLNNLWGHCHGLQFNYQILM